jgi:hypothetical protein
MNRDNHDDRAQRVVSTINDFIQVFTDRVESEHAKNVLYGNEVLHGRKLGDEYGQKPERFIVENLIAEIAGELNYGYRSQPIGFDGVNGYPDFTALNADATVIGEVKKPNKIDDAREESFKYLQDAEDRPLVGIATDGWTWILHTADEGEDPEYTKHVSLRTVFKDLAREEDHNRSPRQDRRKLGKECEEFVEEFGVEAL